MQQLKYSSPAAVAALAVSSPDPTPEETAFYSRYDWCLNAFPTVEECMRRQRDEIEALSSSQRGWQRSELEINAILLACAISEAVDDYLGGARYDFSRIASVFGAAAGAVRQVNRALQTSRKLRTALHRGLHAWRDQWEDAVCAGARALAAADNSESCSWAEALLALHRYNLPAALRRCHVRVPAAFRSQDLSHVDAFRLGDKLCDAFPDRERPLLVVGLRTAGSYFAPLLRGHLETRGYKRVETVTLRPKRGMGARERACLEQSAKLGALAAVIDEPVFSGSTVGLGVDLLRKAGFPLNAIAGLFPVHPTVPDWKAAAGTHLLSGITVLTLDPKEWHKERLLVDGAAQRIQEYYAQAGLDAQVVFSSDAAGLTAELENWLEPGMHWRLKRVFEVRLSNGMAPAGKRYVLAKSAGWGWLGYHGFLAGTRLAPFVPSVLGLRDGIVYMELVPLPDGPTLDRDSDRARLVDAAASYVAARARTLRLEEDPTSGLIQAGRHRGSEELAGILSGAYGWKAAAVLKRPRLQAAVGRLRSPFPTLVDGKMRAADWLDRSGHFVKADFEHHGMGKHELNLTDPAYDLADVILHAGLTASHEERLLTAYRDQSGDTGIAARLFLYKLLAGTWAMNRAFDNLKNVALLGRHEEYNERYLDALHYLVVHTARFCAARCRRPEAPRWAEPLVVLDVDGVIDRQIFGFPSTTSSGIEAVSLLASHGLPVALNTARSVAQTREYCQAYGFTGGVAEYGSYVFDVVSGREQWLVSPESVVQLEELRRELRNIPGVFIDGRCQFIVRAFSYARGTTVPLPLAVISGLMAKLGLDRLKLHQTYTDSTVIAGEVNKGAGLRALLALAGHTELKTVAVGDSEPDLPMFLAATRCFAPGQIGCSQQARALGCKIAGKPYQAGLLEIVRQVVHPDGQTCPKCCIEQDVSSPGDELFLRMLRTADLRPLQLLVRSLADPLALRVFQK